MFDIIQSTHLTAPIAFALTYLLHSTVWILWMLCLVKMSLFNTPLLRNYLWKGALIGGLLTSLFIHFSGNSLLEIHLAQDNNNIVEAAQQTTSEKYTPKVIKDAYVSKKSAYIPIKEAYQNVKTTQTEEVLSIENNPKNTFETKPITLEKAQPVVSNDFKIMPFLLTIGFILWLLGSSFFALKETIRHFIFIKKIGERTITNHPTVLNALQDIQLKLKQKLQIVLSQSAVLESPILIQNREICLPEKAIAKLDNQQMEAMLAHEIAHVMRKDYYWNCFLAVVDTIFFFQPLHRIAIQEIQTTNELLCDEWAAKVTGNNLALAKCLLTVATWIKTPNKTYPLVAGMSLKKSELSDRITSLINLPDMKKQRFNSLKIGLPFIALLAMAIFILPGFTFTNLTDNLPTLRKITVTTHTGTVTYDKPVSEPKNEPTDKQEVEPTDERNINLAKERYVPYNASLTKELEKLGAYQKQLTITDYTEQPIAPYIPPFTPAAFDTPSTNEENVATEKNVLATPVIRLEEKFVTNKNHPYFKLFKEVERKAAEGRKLNIKGIYFANLSCAGTTRPKLGGPIVTNKGDKNSLIFTLDYGDYVEYDTLQNCVHPPGHEASKGWFSNFIGKQIYKATDNDIRGQHPAVVESQWVEQSDNQKQTPIGIKLRGAATVKIAIETTKGQPIKTIANGIFEEGTHEFTFPHVNIKKGTYRLITTVDGATLSQNIRVKRTRFTPKKEKNNCAALLRAVKGNNVEQVRILTQTTDPNCEYREEGEPRSPLNAAARKGNIAIGQLLLAANADVEFRTRGDEGALMGAARHGHLDFVKLMVENGAKINKTVSGDGTALINAVRGGHYEIAKYLLEHGADPMLNVPGDENPIYHATNQGDKMLDLLLKYRKLNK